MNYKEYSCGHKQDVVIINTTLENLSLYTEWQNDNLENLCLKCWLNKKKE